MDTFFDLTNILGLHLFNKYNIKSFFLLLLSHTSLAMNIIMRIIKDYIENTKKYYHIILNIITSNIKMVNGGSYFIILVRLYFL